MRQTPAVTAVSLAAGLAVGGGFGAGTGTDPGTVTTGAERPPPTVPRSEYVRMRELAYRRLVRLRRLRATMRRRPGFVTAALGCVHRLEGSWRAASGNGYWGGLQMDMSFQGTYGAPLLRRYGTANHWPPEAQTAVGVVAFYAGRGWTPWPNTSRGCGL